MSNSIESSKEEILAKSRRLKKDEGLEHAQLKGSKIGEYTLAALVIPILIFSFVTGEITTLLAICAIHMIVDFVALVLGWWNPLWLWWLI